MFSAEFRSEIDDISRKVNVYFHRRERFRKRVRLSVDIASAAETVRIRRVVPPVDVFAVGVDDGCGYADVDRCVDAEGFVAGFFVDV